jgi:chromosome segregation ATPase
MAKTRRINFRLEEETVAKLEKLASHYGDNMTRALEEVLDFFFSLHPEFMLMLQKQAELYRRPVTEIIEAFVIRRIADEGAYLEHYGKPSPRALAEFAPRGGRFLRGDDLYNALKEETKELLEVYDEKTKAGEISFLTAQDEAFLHEVLLQ